MTLAPLLVALAGLLLWPAPSLAQPRPERPYRGLFANNGASQSGESLIASGSIGGGYDDNILLDLPGGGSVDPRIAQSGQLISGNSSLAYSRSGRRANFGASVGANSRYYPGQEVEFLSAYGAGIGGNVAIGRSSNLALSQGVTYQPYAFTSLFPMLFEAGPQQFQDLPVDLATGDDQYLSLDSNARFAHILSQRWTMNLGYNYNKSETAFTQIQGTSRMRFSHHGALAGVVYSITRGLGLRMGYAFQDAEYSGSDFRGRTHNIDVGLDYNKSLSFSRRTSLSFATGTSALSNGLTTSYQATGNARLLHEIGRTWNASAMYERSFRFVETLAQPVFYDAVSLGLGGLLNRRVDVQSGFRAAFGSVGYQSTSLQEFDTMHAFAGIAYGVTRHIQVGANYSFYRYRFDTTVLLPPEVPRNVDRQSVRAQVSVWAPLLNRARR